MINPIVYGFLGKSMTFFFCVDVRVMRRKILWWIIELNSINPCILRFSFLVYFDFSDRSKNLRSKLSFPIRAILINSKQLLRCKLFLRSSLKINFDKMYFEKKWPHNFPSKFIFLVCAAQVAIYSAWLHISLSLDAYAEIYIFFLFHLLELLYFTLQAGFH